MRANTKDDKVYGHKQNNNTNLKDTEHETGDDANDLDHLQVDRTAEARCNTLVQCTAGRADS